jgi:hypothetical protein
VAVRFRPENGFRDGTAELLSLDQDGECRVF